MSYTIKERNDAIMLIGAGKTYPGNISLYEDLQSFNWININSTNGIINSVELTYAGKDLHRRLLKKTAL